MSSNDGLASFFHRMILPQLRHPICEEQKDETTMEEVYAEQIGREGQLQPS
jgi:hypothetical protein